MPLFLIIEKLFSFVAKPYISLKILSFVCSCISLFLFNRILKHFSPNFLKLLLLALFCFSPFVIANSLTLKQYSVDLMLGLAAVDFFLQKEKSFFLTVLFFATFCLMSNVGLFFSAAFAIFYFLKKNNGKWLVRKSIKKAAPFALAPLPYLFYFFWFLQQPGAENMKIYMVHYWAGSFLPLNSEIFKWVALQGKMVYLFFFSSYIFIGIPMLILFGMGIFSLIKKRVKSKTLTQIAIIYGIVLAIHLFLSTLKMYPFSDRLFLYLAPGILIVFGLGVKFCYEILSEKNFSFPYAVYLIPLAALLSYITYFPLKSNDVVGLLKFVNSHKGDVIITHKAHQLTREWLNFTKYEKQDVSKLIFPAEVKDTENINAKYLISHQGIKFGHQHRLTTPDPEIQELLKENKIELQQRLNGYVIYKIR